MNCKLEFCDQKSSARGMCVGHYAQLRKGKELKPLKPRFGGVVPTIGCAAEGCDREHYSRGMCKRHWQHQYRGSNPARIASYRGDCVGYGAAHDRVRAAKGSATDRKCVDCGRWANGWSYTHACPSERLSERGPYSLDLDMYAARCHSCHTIFDKAGQVLA